MPVNRFFVEQKLKEGDLIRLEGEEFHHLIHAMRKRIKSSLELINGKGELAESILENVQKNYALISIHKVFQREDLRPKVFLIQALTRLNRLDTIIEKATELGASSIFLFPGEYSERGDLSPSATIRLKKIAQAALKQSGHLYLPEIVLFPSLFESLPQDGFLCYGDIDPKAPLLIDVLTAKKEETAFAIVIGPESGLSDTEEKGLKERGAIGVKLAEAILRTDTAPIVALGIISHVLLKRFLK